MLSEERQAILLQELQTKGYAHVNEMADRLQVTPITIRRDFAVLEQQGKCSRTRGGAVQTGQGTTPELPYEIKAQRQIPEKQRIAQAAAAHIHEGDIIILDSGSTTFQLASQLLPRRQITVVTNDLKIASLLAVNPSITLICTGGVSRANVYTLLGSQTEQFLKTIRVDKTFLGADAIHPDGVVSNVNLDEVAIKQAMLAACSQRILLADSSKFGVRGFARVCAIYDLDLVITDDSQPKDWRERLENWQVKTELV